MAPIVPLLPAIGAVASAGGALYSGIATGEAANYQAQVASNNALIEQQNAQSAIAAGQQQTATQSLKNAATLGAVKAGQAANGIDVNTGSAVDVQASERAKGELDAETTLNNAQIQAYGYRVNAVSDTAQAQLDQATAENAPIAGGLSAAGGLLGNSKFTGWIGGTDGSTSSNANAGNQSSPSLAYP